MVSEIKGKSNMIKILMVIFALIYKSYGQGPEIHRLTSALNDCTGCKMEIVESIPEDVTFPGFTEHLTTFDSWKQLINLAESTIEIGSYYWTMQGHEYEHPTGEQGKEIFNLLKAKGLEGTVKINIAVDNSSTTFKNEDTAELEKSGAATVRHLNFRTLLNSGVLHTKMWVVDRKHVYIGSANFDWRALTQVKELGILVTNCSCIGEDLGKAFDVYWKLGEPGSQIPEEWGPEFESEYNKSNTFEGNFNGIPYSSYISSSPPQMCPSRRTTDLESIFDVMDNATDYIHVAVMDYFPLILFDGAPRYWSDIENRLKKSAIDRRVKIKLLMAKWSQTKRMWTYFLKSLADLHEAYPWVDIQIKMFEVPSTEDQSKIPFARVNHNKYMVTDKSAYIGTSNWSGDYFISSAGIAMVVTPRGTDQNNIHTQIASIFMRDWESPYSKPLSEYLEPESETTTIKSEENESSIPTNTAVNFSLFNNYMIFVMVQILLRLQAH